MLVVVLVLGALGFRDRKETNVLQLVHRLICSWHMAAGQLAVFQGASDEHI